MSFEVAAMRPPLLAKVAVITPGVPAAPAALSRLIAGPLTPCVGVGVGGASVGVEVAPPLIVMAPSLPPALTGLARASDAPGVLCRTTIPAFAPAAIVKLQVNNR